MPVVLDRFVLVPQRWGIMATRAPRSASRPRPPASRTRQGNAASGTSRGSTGSTTRGGTGGTTRSGTSRGSSTSRSGSTRTSKSGRGTATPYRRGSSARGGSKGKSARRPPPPDNPLLILVGWLVAAISQIWMALAHTVGAAARAFGRSARDLDPAHRRDGLGLLAVCAAIISAAALWWHLGFIGRPLSAFLHGLFGSGAWTIPILLVLLAIRFLRHPDGNAETGRMVVGWTALVAGILGLIHIADGTPGRATAAPRCGPPAG